MAHYPPGFSAHQPYAMQLCHGTTECCHPGKDGAFSDIAQAQPHTLFQKGGIRMAKEKQALTFTFVNPNGAKAFERQLRRVLIDRLIARYSQDRH